MNQNSKHRLEEIKESGYALDFGEVLEQTFANYKRTVLMSGAIMLLVSFVFIAILMGIALVFAGVTTYTQTLTDYQPGTSSTGVLIVNLIGSVLAAAFMAPLTAGLLELCRLADAKKELSLAVVFQYYKSEHVKNLILGGVLVAFAAQAMSILAQLLATSITDYPFAFAFLGTLIGLFINFLTMLMIPLIVFGQLSATEAIKASALLVLKRFWLIFALVIITLICSLLGFIALCIGFFFTIPLLYSLQYVIYKNAMGVEEKDELDEIGFHTDSF